MFVKKKKNVWNKRSFDCKKKKEKKSFERKNKIKERL